MHTPRNTPFVRRNLVAALGIAAMGAGCSTASISAEGRPYPVGKSQAESVNIQVSREVTEILLTNTTAGSFGPSILWINSSYSRTIDGLTIGQSLRLSLAEFRNEFGEPFRAGGFFATEPPDRVVQVQLEGERGMIGLIIVGGGRE